MDQNSQNIVLFWSITHGHLTYLDFNAIFEFLWQFTIIIFQKGVANFELKTYYFLVRGVVRPLFKKWKDISSHWSILHDKIEKLSAKTL